MPTRRSVLLRISLGLALVSSFAIGIGIGVLGSHDTVRVSVAAPVQPSVLDEAAALIGAQAAKPVDKATLERAAVQGMLSVLGDKWSGFYPPAGAGVFAAALEGRYDGVGVWLRANNGGDATVASVVSASPAERAGLRNGDVLLSIDGVAVVGRGVTVAAGLLRGMQASTVELTVRRGSAIELVKLARTSVDSPYVLAEQLKHGVLRVAVTSFVRGVGRQVREALVADPSRTGVILDLRGNPGGLLDEAVEVAGAFLDGGTVVSYSTRDTAPVILTAAPGGNTTTPLVVLVDGATASAAEVVAAAMQDRGRAVVVGARTFGKGSVQKPLSLVDGSVIEFTVGTYRTPNNRSIDGIGVDPDVSMSPTATAADAETRALTVLDGLEAALGRDRG